jgi:hypothetical protein
MREAGLLKKQNGVVPLIGTDAAARADALVRVPEFLKRHLQEKCMCAMRPLPATGLGLAA